MYTTLTIHFKQSPTGRILIWNKAVVAKSESDKKENAGHKRNSQVVVVTVLLVILPPVVVTAVTLMEYSTPGTRSLSVILLVVLLVDNVDS